MLAKIMGVFMIAMAFVFAYKWVFDPPTSLRGSTRPLKLWQSRFLLTVYAIVSLAIGVFALLHE